jgi:hypothetical protein
MSKYKIGTLLFAFCAAIAAQPGVTGGSRPTGLPDSQSQKGANFTPSWLGPKTGSLRASSGIQKKAATMTGTVQKNIRMSELDRFLDMWK